MKIAVLGTGMVGQILAGRFAGLGHSVTTGTRDPQTTLARTEAGQWGTPAFAVWQADHPAVKLATFAAASADAELVVNATSGGASLGVLAAAGAENLAGKVILDVANALDFANGPPPSLSIVNTDSLGEQIQRAHPAAKVVKSLNTMNCLLMVEPSRLLGEHVVFMAGDHADAKATVRALLLELGWAEDTILDLGALASARGTEMFMPLWLSLMSKLGTAEFNINVVTA
jgi:8-hydroxy-5-deazaflavin:NADPH oxidoreductase